MNTNQYGQVSHLITDSKEYAIVVQVSTKTFLVVTPCRLHCFFATNTERKANNYLKKLLKYNQPV
jgi:hypothetical protein